MIRRSAAPGDWAFDLSVIIVSYNTREILRHCLRSIFHQDHGVRLQVIVVDNASRDHSAAMVRKEFPEVLLLENARNEGFSAGNNRALPHCAGEFVLLLNSDTIVLPGTLARMVAFARRRPEAGILGCKLVRPDGELDWACRRGFPTPLVAFFKFLGLHRIVPRSRLFGRYNMTYLDPDLTYEVDSVVGAFLMIRQSVLGRLRGLDEDFFMYGEDLDLCFRAKQAAFRVYYVGENQVIHIKGASSRKEAFRMNYHFHRAMILFHRKHLRRRYPAAVNAVTYAGIGLRFTALALRHHVRALAGRARRATPRWGLRPSGEAPVAAGGDAVV
ncbi:MAG: glycosyltransferase family 2 protein [Planctomycetes bacterium]|nr:glycosyltransferase family 2 protein [Planctomycetota bacterium]